MTDEDMVTITWENERGDIYEVKYTLEEAAARGEAVAGRGNVEVWTGEDRIAKLEAASGSDQGEVGGIEA
jgi:hypothetical protein